MEIDKKEVGNRIKTIRINLKETTAEFAEHFNPPASNSLVSRWERGVNLPNNERIKVIAELGKMSVEELLYGDPYINTTVDEYLTEQFNRYLGNKEELLRRIKSLAKTENDFILDTFNESEGIGINETYDQMQKRLNNLKKFGYKVIADNYNNHTYEKHKQYYDNHDNYFYSSDIKSFQEYKEREWEILKEIFDNFWGLYDITAKDGLDNWINKRFTSKVKDKLSEILIQAVEEGQEDYYINDLVQPILDDAADNINDLMI